MLSRSFAAVSVLCLSLLLLPGCATETEYVQKTIDEARASANARDYDRAHRLLDIARDRVGEDFALVFEKAEIYARAHDFERATLWYDRAVETDPASWKAAARGWNARFQRDGEADSARKRVLEDVRAHLAAAPDSLANLSAAVATWIELGEEDAAEEARERLMSLYPDSELGSELIKEDVDWIGVERDDRRRLEMSDEFLERHPTTRWRPRVMRLKLVSLERLGRCDDVESLVDEWSSEYKDDAEVLNILARALDSCGRSPDVAAELAARATELTFARCDSEGMAVVERGRRRLLRATRDGVDDSALEKRVEELASYHLTLARALVAAENYDGALTAARAAASFLDLDANDEETGAAYQFTLGQALEGLGEHDDAFTHYMNALLTGGRQNRWPARADTAIARLFETEFAPDEGTSLLEFARERARYDGPVFTDVTASAGLEDRRESRIAWGDCDGDGYDDLLLSGRVLMRNLGDGTFEDVSEAAGIAGTGTNGGVWADIDNDGDLDFYATSGATSGEMTDRLWVNRGDGTFEDGTEAAGGMTDHCTTEGAAWGDADADGLVDLYLASYERPRTEEFEEYGVGFSDILYRNAGDGVFVDVTDEAGIVPPFGRHLSGRGVNWGDYDNDGDLDIFVSNYRLQENFLWKNDGRGRFVNVAPSAGVSGRETDGWWGHTIGSEWGDYDSDGDLDLISANLAHPRYIEVSDMSMLLENGGPPDWTFADRRADAGIKYAETHSDPAWGDVDADGDLDLFITAIYPGCGTFLYENVGRGRFEDITWLAGVRSFNGWGCAMSDYDLDGDLDVAVASGSGFRLFRNDGSAGRARGNHWVAVKPVGTRSNAAGIGARVTVTCGDRTQMCEIQGGKGTTSQHSMTAFFGLGDERGPVDIEVRFLGGGTAVLSGVQSDRRYVIEESAPDEG